MMRLTAKVSRAMRNGIGTSFSLLKPPRKAAALPTLARQFSANGSTFTPNPVATEMIKYATSLARDQKTGAAFSAEYFRKFEFYRLGFFSLLFF